MRLISAVDSRSASTSGSPKSAGRPLAPRLVGEAGKDLARRNAAASLDREVRCLDELRLEPVAAFRLHREQEVRRSEHRHPYQALDVLGRTQQHLVSGDQMRRTACCSLGDYPQIRILLGTQAAGPAQRREPAVHLRGRYFKRTEVVPVPLRA